MTSWSDIVYAGIGVISGGAVVKFLDYLRDGLRLRESEGGRLWAEIGRLHAELGELKAQLRTVSTEREQLRQENLSLRYEVDDLLEDAGKPRKYIP